MMHISFQVTKTCRHKKQLTKLEDCASKRSLGMLDSSQIYQMLNKIKKW